MENSKCIPSPRLTPSHLNLSFIICVFSATQRMYRDHKVSNLGHVNACYSREDLSVFVHLKTECMDVFKIPLLHGFAQILVYVFCSYFLDNDYLVLFDISCDFVS
jgi:hypothetical protein